MSLDEIRRQLEEKKQREIEKKQKDQERAKAKKLAKENQLKETRRVENSIDSSIQGNIGSVKILFTQDLLNLILQKIWDLDKTENSVLDNAIIDLIQKRPADFRVNMDITKLYSKIRENVFFVLNSGKRVPYNEFRQSWQQYVGSGLDIDFNPKRREFVQLLTNRFKPHWVDSEGIPLSEGLFQMLYRIEREPKAIERLFEFLEESYFNVMNDQDKRAFFNKIRIQITKIIKEELLDFINLTKGNTNQNLNTMLEEKIPSKTKRIDSIKGSSRPGKKEFIPEDDNESDDVDSIDEIDDLDEDSKV
jgi:hypothetical protein